MLVISLALALAQSDSFTAGLDAFRRGDYVTAEKMLNTSSDPRAATYANLARAATGGCDSVRDGLAQQLATQADAETRRAAGLGAAQCYVAAERFESALPILARLRRDYPSDADVLYLTAKLHMKAWNDALFGLYRNAPSSYRVNQISGEVFEMHGRFAEAAGEYRKAIEKNPAAVNLHFRLGRALLLESNSPASLDAAAKEFQAELALNPNDAVAEYQIGQILTARQKPAEAAERYKRAAAIDPKFVEPLIALGRIRTAEKNHAEAITLLERAVASAPKSEAARYNLMLAYRNAGRREEARKQQEELERLQKPPEGEFTEFLKRLGEKTPGKTPEKTTKQ